MYKQQRPITGGGTAAQASMGCIKVLSYTYTHDIRTKEAVAVVD